MAKFLNGTTVLLILALDYLASSFLRENSRIDFDNYLNRNRHIVITEMEQWVQRLYAIDAQKSVLGFQKLRFNLERGTHQSDPGQVDI
jgi:hypothetical protein